MGPYGCIDNWYNEQLLVTDIEKQDYFSTQ